MKMYASPLIAALTLTVAHQAAALDFYELEGSWKGIRTETRDGAGTYTAAKLYAAKKSDGSLAVTESGSSKTFGKYTVKHVFKKSGKYQATLIDSGEILATTTGSWTKTNDTINMSGRTQNGTTTTTFSGSIKRVSDTKVIYVGKSGGIVVKISSSR